jgi:hypothetical protein
VFSDLNHALAAGKPHSVPWPKWKPFSPSAKATADGGREGGKEGDTGEGKEGETAEGI